MYEKRADENKLTALRRCLPFSSLGSEHEVYSTGCVDDDTGVDAMCLQITQSAGNGVCVGHTS